jgi:hypothetical protein
MLRSINWKRATKIALVCSLMSLPMWAAPRGGDRGGRGHGGDGGCGNNRNCKDVPEGGSALAYTALSSVMIAGAFALARKSREV